MSGKNQYPTALNWQSTSPATGFLPLNNKTESQGSIPSGTLAGTMSSTNTIYTNILDLSRYDNSGLEVTWAGTPTGTISVMCSNSGINFYALTFDPVLAQPAGSSGGYLINLNQLPFRYMFVQYVNSSGSGSITVYAQQKDLN